MNLAYPFSIGNDGLAATAGDPDHIEQLIEQLLFTMPGERVNRPDFGAPVAQFVFRGNNDETAAAIQFMLQGALQQWLGDLIQVQEVVVESDEAALVITVTYVVRATRQVQTATFSR